MFGYIKPDKNELKLKYIKRYKNLYRIACRLLIKHFGLFGINKANDVVFLLSVFNGLETEREDYKNPDVQLSEKAVDYTLLIVSFCIYERLRSESKFLNKIMFYLFNKSDKRKSLFIEYKELIKIFRNKLDEYYVLKKENSNFDKLSDKIGELYAEIFSGYLVVDSNDSMYKFGFCFGKWLYMINTFNSLNKDISNNKFNPILFLEKSFDGKAISKRVILLSDCIIKKMLLQLGDLQLVDNSEIIYNIIKCGMPVRVQNIIDKTAKAIGKNS